jgi:hypothetical protein
VLTLPLTQQTSQFGGTIAECTQFADGYTWGSVRLADLTIGGETAKSLPIQIIGDISKVPSDCSNTGPAEDTVMSFGANGIIGVGTFQADCGAACVQTPGYEPPPGSYYSCQAGECVDAFVPLSSQVQNPVGLFPVDNNGVQLRFPAISAGGATNVTGSLIFGIGTQPNNGLGSATVMPTDPDSGGMIAKISGVAYNGSFVDSGSSAFFLPSSFAATCTNMQLPGYSYLCPPITIGFAGTLQGENGNSPVGNLTNISFSVANTTTLFQDNPNATAFNNLAAPNSISNSVDLGLPFFFGRNIFSAIEGKSTPGGVGPYGAF